jgi:hypothetical protein
MSTPRSGDPSCTIGDILHALCVPEIDADNWTDWPPDVFAVVAAILRKTGAYTRVVQRWPPTSASRLQGSRAGDWAGSIRGLGDRWRGTAAARKPAPGEVLSWWNQLLGSRAVSISDVAKNEELCDSLLQLTAVADEACRGVGVPPYENKFEWIAAERLLATHSLGWKIDPGRVKVLPKLHAPRSGMTLRSLTHHLALCPSEDVNAQWWILPGGPAESTGLNLLLLPWPMKVTPRQFRPVDGGLLNMPDRFGFFQLEPDADIDGWIDRASAAFDAASELVGAVHGVVLPELALPETALAPFRDYCVRKKRAFLISGVSGRTKTSKSPSYGRNYVAFDVPLPSGIETSVLPQPKHHRWKLDRSQILQYGCGANLTHTREWWEHIELGSRSISFVSMNPWLTVSVLICEDLARQDPVGEIIRAVGPNLVVALLMDGPQLASRWSARYATVLADDPGCSVLTLTSLGMALLSRPPGKAPSRVVGLWKDALQADPVELVLPEGADALVLTLSAEFREEWTADGRSDGETTGYPVLAGVHPVAVSHRPSRRTIRSKVKV